MVKDEYMNRSMEVDGGQPHSSMSGMGGMPPPSVSTMPSLLAAAHQPQPPQAQPQQVNLTLALDLALVFRTRDRFPRGPVEE